ncbi:MAG TPA: TonB-dependent receptor [Pyrinomonadaceae bacterium]|nr:TonB-dependent receptor [Pyrinomonadaceae bacterium]
MKRHIQLKTIISLLTLLFAISGAALGQEVTGDLLGTVKDSTGALVKGASVTVTDPSKANAVVRTLTTNDDGGFFAPNVTPGVYQLTVEAPNFKKYVVSDVKVDVGQKRSVDITLEPGNISEVVTIAADAVAVELTTPTASTLISGDQARELSLNNRNFVQLVALAPGVSSNLEDQVYVGTVNPTGQANTINLAVNGARSSQNTFTVDGADITDRGSNITIQAYPSVDSIGEFKVLRSLFAAESGRSGGGQVNIVTRSGTNEFHGSLFEFVRNEKLNANEFLLNQTAPLGLDENGKAKRPPFRYNNFGGTIGGPIYFPRFGEGSGSALVKVPRTYFFFSEEQRRDRRYPTLSSTVPDALMRQGIFPIDICLRANAPTAATAQCLDVLPAGQALSSRVPINPVAQQYLTFIYNNLPLPTNALTRALTFPAKNVADFRQEILKIDHAVNDKISMYYRFENDKIPTEDVNALFSSGSGLPGVSTTSTNSPGKAHTFQLTYVISPKVIAVGRFTHGYGAILSENIGLLALRNSPITPNLPFQNERDRVPTVTGNGFSNLQSFGPYDNFSWKQNYDGSMTWIHGGHTLKFGGIFSRYRKNENALAGNNEGLYNNFLNTVASSPNQLSVLAPQVPGQDTNAARRTNFQAFANFLMGNNVQFTQAHFDYTADLRQKTIEGYAQDEWRVRPNLTVYYGVRYSYFGSPYDQNGRLTNFVPELWNPAAAPLVTGAGNRVAGAGKNFCNGLIANAQNFLTSANCTPVASPYGKYVVDSPKKNFAPRFGIAWDPFGTGTTSIRTGYGIYHDQVLNGTLLQMIGLNPPYQETIQIQNTRLDQPLPPGSPITLVAAATAPNLRGIQADWTDPYMQHWSLDVQRQLDSNTVVTFGYFGSKGTHLIGAFELNELPPGFAISRGATGCAVGASTTPTAPCQVAGQAFGVAGLSSNILDQIRPFRGYRSLTIIQPRFNSSYHSLQVFAQRRFAGKSQASLAYTWSKNLTDNQTDRSTAPQSSFDISLEKGRAALDRRHVLTANYNYELPFFLKEDNGLVKNVLGGWEASGIIVYNTGLPLTPATSAFDPAGLGFIPALIAGGRPNLLCDPNENAPHTQQEWFNTACLQDNPTVNSGIPNVIGNAGRGIINGPPTFRVDFSMLKNIRFGETKQLQLRAEAFNVFNHTNFKTIGSTNVTSALLGVVTATRDPRTIQLGAKFIF